MKFEYGYGILYVVVHGSSDCGVYIVNKKSKTDTYQGLSGCVGALFTVLVCLPIVLIALSIAPVTTIIILIIAGVIAWHTNKMEEENNE